MFYQTVTTISVRDLEASLAFYRDVLGFRVVHRLYDLIVHLTAPGMTLALRQLDGNAAAAEESHVHLGLIAGDLDALRRDLEQKGVYFIGETVDTPFAKVAFFNDPDGTPLYLCQWTSWAESAA